MVNTILRLKEVKIEGIQTPAIQKGDTIQLNASSFKVNRDASTEDLLLKMPGISIENGKVKAQGEEVKKVLIDGKEFFGDDASVAIKNLPADLVDKIQFFDKLSDQAQFTGFDDGNSRKTMNILTRGGLRDASFGRFNAGLGLKQYKSNIVYNRFKEDRRLTLLAQSNNINQQNFSGEDLMGLAAGSSHGGFSDRMSRAQGLSPGANDPSNFMVGQQGGINTTHSIGMSYTDSIGRKIKLNGSYFFNNTVNQTEKDLLRYFYTSASNGKQYAEKNNGWSNNLNHRITLRIELNIDSMNSIIYTPRFSWQGNQNGTNLLGLTKDFSDTLFSSETKNNLSGNGLSVAQNILIRHKFRKRGRTISLLLNTDIQNRESETDLISERLPSSGNLNLNIRQDGISKSVNNNYSGNLYFTENIGKNIQFFTSLNASFANGPFEKQTWRLDPVTGVFLKTDSLLSNNFNRELLTYKEGLGIRMQTRRMTMMANVFAQQVYLSGDQTFPFYSGLKKNFFNVLPMAMFNYKFNTSSNIRIFYRTYTNAPSSAQLQNVGDNTNPLQLFAGNPDLVQEYNHNVNIRYGKANVENGRSFFFNFSGTRIQHYIGNSMIIAGKDTILADGTILRGGAQLSRPVNLNESINTRSLFTYSIPLKVIYCNLNLQAGFNYSLIPGQTNFQRNQTNNYAYTGGAVLASNINEQIDFTLAYTGGWNIISNILQPGSNNNFYTQNLSLKGNWVFYKNFLINTSFNYSGFWGLNNFSREFFLWNLDVAYKFMKEKRTEIRISAFDLLGQNTSIARVITENYTEDSKTKILTRFFMLSFNYNLRKIKEMHP